jgi:hypothetical protein
MSKIDEQGSTPGIASASSFGSRQIKLCAG